MVTQVVSRITTALVNNELSVMAPVLDLLMQEMPSHRGTLSNAWTVLQQGHLRTNKSYTCNTALLPATCHQDAGHVADHKGLLNCLSAVITRYTRIVQTNYCAASFRVYNDHIRSHAKPQINKHQKAVARQSVSLAAAWPAEAYKWNLHVQQEVYKCYQ
jgi:hypothetical protein